MFINIDNLEIARRKTNLSKRETALRSDMTERTFLKFYKQGYDPKLSTIQKVAKTLNTTVAFITGEYDLIVKEIQKTKTSRLDEIEKRLEFLEKLSD